MNSKQRCALRKRLRAKGYDENFISQIIKRREADSATAIAGERTTDKEVLFPAKVKRTHERRKQISKRRNI